MGRPNDSTARCSGHRLRFKPISALALIAIVLIGAACAPAGPTGPVATNAPALAVAQPMAPTTAPTQPVATAPTASQPGKKLALPVGVDTDGNFYRGDPKAPVKFVDFSDFQ